MLEIASQIILCLLLAALLGFIIGYLLGKSACTNEDCESTPTNSHDTHSIADDTKDSNAKPTLLDAPRGGEKDNLTRIKGVGVKIEEALNNIGIYHFDQIAGWDAENIAWADSTLGFPGRAKREKWVSQSKALAAGEETEFSKRVDEGKVSSSKKA